VSGVGNAIVALTIPWLVLERTGSPAAAGLVAAVSSAPAALASPLAGWAVDRLGRRAVSIIADIFSAIAVFGIPIAALLSGLSVPVIIGLAILGAIFDPAGYTGRKALIADVAHESRFSVVRLNGIHEGIFAVGWTIGPLFAAVLIATVGAVNAFWVPFVLFIAAALLIGFLRVNDAGQEARAEAIAEGRIEAGFWATAGLGIRIIWRDKPLRALTIAILVLAAVYMPTETVIWPTYFESMGMPWGLGAVIAALAGGSVIGSFGYGWLAARLSLLTITRLALIGTMVAIAPLALLPPLPIMMVAAFVLGLSWGPMNPLLTTIVQRRVPADAQGRVFGVQLSVFYAAPPIAMLITGLAIEGIGLQPTFLILAGVLILTGVVVLFVRSIHAIDS
jgi:MFS family permease